MSVATPRGSAGSCTSFAMPKSRILAVPVLVTKMFSGLRSRCTSPRACAATRPLVTAHAMRRASSSEAGPRPMGTRRDFAVEKFRYEVRAAVRHSHIEHFDDVGVVERCGDARFLKEPLDRLPIAALGVGERLDRDVSTESWVVRSVDVSHAATSQQRDDPVRSDQGAFRKGGLFLRQISGSEDQGGSFEKPVGRTTGGGELVGQLKQCPGGRSRSWHAAGRARRRALRATYCASPKGRASARCSCLVSFRERVMKPGARRVPVVDDGSH